MDIIVHTMEFSGEPVCSTLTPANYAPGDYREYRETYEACFAPMRVKLGLAREGCPDAEALARDKEHIFVLKERGRIAGSVRLRENEIDDLVVAADFQNRAIGTALLRFAIALLQKDERTPIILHVAAVSEKTMKLYRLSGFRIVKTETIVRQNNK